MDKYLIINADDIAKTESGNMSMSDLFEDANKR